MPSTIQDHALRGRLLCFVFTTLFLMSALPSSAQVPAGPPRVILLHGLGRTGASMKCIERHLRRSGYEVCNITYPSRRLSVEQIANEFLPEALARLPAGNSAPVHFVTHSLGGIVVRAYLANHAVPNLGRVVMLAPPNRGSEVADFLRRSGLLRRVMGPAFQQLGTTDRDVPQTLGPVQFELGVIAGNRSLNPLFSALIRGADDGKVSVASTQVEGMKDFVVLPLSHTWMVWRRATMEQIAHFLEHGCFASVKRRTGGATALTSIPR